MSDSVYTGQVMERDFSDSHNGSCGHSSTVLSKENYESDQTVHNWEDEKNKHKWFYEETSINFFWRAHTITCLFLFTCVLLYVTVAEDGNYSTEYNIKRGILAMVLAFLLFGVIQTPDGPFIRPHPAFWRFILCLSIVYEMCLIFLLFQNVDDARRILTYFDSELGKPLPEKNYGGNCLLYDSNNSQDPWHNIWDKMDGFVPVHFFGWWMKTLILRDYWLAFVLSFMFEILEYTLEHQLPNFSECWWDHWILDFVVCNTLGIYFGMKTCNYLSMKPYYWTSLWSTQGYKKKLQRFALQFTPHRWTDFDWHPTESIKRWLFMIVVIGIFLMAELNTFYLKYILWIPPSHSICLGRLIFFLFMGATALRETFQFLDDKSCTRFGRQSWLICAIIFTEIFIVVKFANDIVTMPLPRQVVIFWLIGIFMLIVWTVWHFYLKRFLFTRRILKQNLSAATTVATSSSKKAQ